MLSASTVAQQAGVDSRPVEVQEVKQTLFSPTVDIVGTVYSRHNVKLTAGVNGRIDYVAEPGSIVHKGDAVARIDPLPLTLQKAEQQAEIKRAQINIRYLEREVNRLTALRQTNAASAFQLDQTQSQFELAKADYDIATLRLKQIDDQLTRTTVVAPFTGVVTERLREAGADVNRSEILVNFLDTENLEARMFVPVKYIPFIRHHNTILVTSDLGQVNATVKAIIPAADTRSQSFELRVSLPVEANSTWTAGQLVRASLPVQAPQEQLTVHRDALILRQDGTYVIIIDSENKAHRLKVTVGEGMGEYVSITDTTLQVGDRVATRGAERLQEGQTVTIANQV